MRLPRKQPETRPDQSTATATAAPVSAIDLRPAGSADLDAINRVVEAALMSWPLPARVKRLSLPSYRYSAVDLEHLEMVVALDRHQQIIGVAAWEEADTVDVPGDRKALLLHGIYVDPSCHRQGVGRELYRCAERAVRQYGYGGLLVKAQQSANGFFMSQGMSRLQAEDPSRHYTNRFWMNADR